MARFMAFSIILLITCIFLLTTDASKNWCDKKVRDGDAALGDKIDIAEEYNNRCYFSIKNLINRTNMHQWYRDPTNITLLTYGFDMKDIVAECKNYGAGMLKYDSAEEELKIGSWFQMQFIHGSRNRSQVHLFLAMTKADAADEWQWHDGSKVTYPKRFDLVRGTVNITNAKPDEISMIYFFINKDYPSQIRADPLYVLQKNETADSRDLYDFAEFMCMVNITGATNPQSSSNTASSVSSVGPGIGTGTGRAPRFVSNWMWAAMMVIAGLLLSNAQLFPGNHLNIDADQQIKNQIEKSEFVLNESSEKK